MVWQEGMKKVLTRAAGLVAEDIGADLFIKTSTFHRSQVLSKRY
jgi:hypothetical protein